MVVGAQDVSVISADAGESTEESGSADPWVTQIWRTPATVVSTTLEEPSTGRTRPS